MSEWLIDRRGRLLRVPPESSERMKEERNQGGGTVEQAAARQAAPDQVSQKTGPHCSGASLLRKKTREMGGWCHWPQHPKAQRKKGSLTVHASEKGGKAQTIERKALNRRTENSTPTMEPRGGVIVARKPRGL